MLRKVGRHREGKRAAAMGRGYGFPQPAGGRGGDCRPRTASDIRLYAGAAGRHPYADRLLAAPAQSDDSGRVGDDDPLRCDGYSACPAGADEAGRRGDDSVAGVWTVPLFGGGNGAQADGCAAQARRYGSLLYGFGCRGEAAASGRKGAGAVQSAQPGIPRVEAGGTASAD